MTAQAVHWINYTFIAFNVIAWPIEIRRWLALRRIYGAIPWSMIPQMIAYTRMSPAFGGTPLMLGFFFCLLLAAIDADRAGYQLYKDDTHSLVLLAFLVLAWLLNFTAGLVRPPAVLFLGTSSEYNIHILRWLNSILGPYRAVSLLASEGDDGTYIEGFSLNNFRTRNSYQWRTIVYHLMDVVPVIVINISRQTRYVDTEILRLKVRDLLYRTIALQEDEMPSLPIARESDLHEWLTENIRSRILKCLEHPRDIRRRNEAQKLYTTMIRSVRLMNRYSSSINGMLMKSQDIQAWSFERYLRECKGISTEAIGERLVDQIPSTVPLAVEQHFLRDFRGFEECENVLESALEFAQDTPGPQQQFNIGNAHTKLGKLAWIRQDWKTAKVHLHKAIAILEETTKDRQSSHFSHAMTEMRDSHYFLNRLHMSLFRRRGDIADRMAAERHGRLCEASE